MSKNYLTYLIIPFIMLEVANAKEVDCRVIAGGTSECNPYGARFVKAKEVKYDLDRKKLIIVKTLPVPEKRPPMKVVSVEDMIERYVKVEDPIRFKGTEEIPLAEIKKERIYTQKDKIRFKRKELFDKLQKFKEEQEKKRFEALEFAEEEKRELDKEKEKRLWILRLAEEEKKHKDQGLYLIQKGDGLSTIAAKFGITKKELLTLNNLEKTSAIRVGKKLIIPFAQKKIDAMVDAELQGFYVIEKGDGLGTIAAKFSITKKDLRTLNNLEKTSTIKVGKKLIIPYAQRKIDAIVRADYIVEKGDTFSSIALEFNLTSKAIMKHNNLKKGSAIRLGQKVLLPLPHIVKKKKIAKLQKKKNKTKLIQSFDKKQFSKSFGRQKLRVTATAYSSHKQQTDDTPFLAAWNNRLRPGMKIIAVSRDMLTRYGMKNGTRVRIAGLPGYYRVRDKMNKRYSKRIDIYMGVNRRKALRWGRRSVVIYW